MDITEQQQQLIDENGGKLTPDLAAAAKKPQLQR